MSANLVRKEQATKPSAESLYRTRWLMAHNHLHDLVNGSEAADVSELKLRWDQYLDEIRSSEELASQPA